MSRVLKLQEKLQKIPFGQKIFSKLVARNAPYFQSISPYIIELKPHSCSISMKKRKKVLNHLKTVHAIAMCNLCELTGGLCLEASIPKTHRWIPMGMKVSYLKKAKTNLIGTCHLPKIDWENTRKVVCHVEVTDIDNVIVMEAHIDMKISLKK